MGADSDMGGLSQAGGLKADRESSMAALGKERACQTFVHMCHSEVDFMRNISEATSGCLYAEATQTLIFLDWDDTLFPTTELFDTWGLPREAGATVELPDKLAAQLESWRAALTEFLSSACTLSERCIIVTNSKRPWVHNCVRRFAPAIQLLLEQESGLSVVYARELTGSKQSCHRPEGLRAVLHELRSEEEELREHLTKAKQAAMRQEAKEFYSRYPGQTWKNVLSIGDMAYEHVAVQEVTFRRASPARERLRTKAITVPTSPSLGVITCRLHCFQYLLQAWVRFDGDLSVNLEEVPDPLDALAQAMQMPKIRTLIPMGYAWGRGPAPSDEEHAAMLQELSRLVQFQFYQDLCSQQVNSPPSSLGA